MTKTHTGKKSYANYKQVSFYARITLLSKVHKLKSRKSNTKFPLKTVYFLGVGRLITSSYIVYDYTTSGHTDF